ncbi:MAG TPA: PTS sugar transporter subunit IIA [Burkholderiaceae bacterium]|nr:PTS sugar transporter subunit IIA [Burkholderiaceae bacterium]
MFAPARQRLRAKLKEGVVVRVSISRLLRLGADLVINSVADLPEIVSRRRDAKSLEGFHLSEGQRPNSLSLHLSPEDVYLDLDVATKRQLFHVIGQHMSRQHGLSAQEVVLNLSQREQAGSTGVGDGVALPHARVDGLTRIYAFYAYLRTPIPFDSHDGKPVSDVVALLVPRPATQEHLTVLADAVQLLSSRRLRKRLHASRSARDAMAVFREGTVRQPNDVIQPGVR